MITLLRLLEELNEIMNRKHRTQKKVLITGHCRHQPLLQTRLWDPFLYALSILLFSEPIFRKWRIAKHTINWLQIPDIIPPVSVITGALNTKSPEPLRCSFKRDRPLSGMWLLSTRQVLLYSPRPLKYPYLKILTVTASSGLKMIAGKHRKEWAYLSGKMHFP